MRLFAIIAVLGLAGCGGEPWEVATELRPALVQADEYIGEHFGKRFCDLDAIDIYWGDSTFALEGNIIFINRSAREQTEDVAGWMRHELFHLTTGLRNGEAVYYNGVRIADWIDYELAKKE